MSKGKESCLRLERIARDSGAVLFGIGEISDLKEKFDHFPDRISHDLNVGISFGVKVSARVLEEIEDHPTRLYMHHYRSINILLDQIALRVSGAIEEEGYDAIPIPASQIIDWERQTAHLSHKMIAKRAGLGWIGRNNLIINPGYGAQVRYGSILTNMPLNTDTRGLSREHLSSEQSEREGEAPKAWPLEGATQAPMIAQTDCGDCYRCLSVCPASAIKESYKDYDMNSCLDKLKWFQKTYNIQHYICGICVKVCRGNRGGTNQEA